MVATTYFWDPVEDNVVQSMADDNSLNNYNTEPIGFGQVLSVNLNGANQYLHSDALGSILAATDSNQNAAGNWGYTAFGKEAASTGEQPGGIGFCGVRQYFKASGGDVIYVRRRSYRPSLARWLSVDPLDLLPLDYLYVENSPNSYVDMSGLARTRLEPCQQPSQVAPPALNLPVLAVSCQQFIDYYESGLLARRWSRQYPSVTILQECAWVYCHKNCSPGNEDLQGRTFPGRAGPIWGPWPNRRRPDLPPTFAPWPNFPCSVCLDSNIVASLSDWIGLLIHESIHVDQFINSGRCGCAGNRRRERQFNSNIVLDCSRCRSWEEDAYKEQARWLHLDRNRTLCFVELGICNSCRSMCQESSEFHARCRRVRNHCTPPRIQPPMEPPRRGLPIFLV